MTRPLHDPAMAFMLPRCGLEIGQPVGMPSIRHARGCACKRAPSSSLTVVAFPHVPVPSSYSAWLAGRQARRLLNLDRVEKWFARAFSKGIRPAACAVSINSPGGPMLRAASSTLRSARKKRQGNALPIKRARRTRCKWFARSCWPQSLPH